MVESRIRQNVLYQRPNESKFRHRSRMFHASALISLFFSSLLMPFKQCFLSFLFHYCYLKGNFNVVNNSTSLFLKEIVILKMVSVTGIREVYTSMILIGRSIMAQHLPKGLGRRLTTQHIQMKVCLTFVLCLKIFIKITFNDQRLLNCVSQSRMTILNATCCCDKIGMLHTSVFSATLSLKIVVKNRPVKLKLPQYNTGSARK